MQEVLFDNILLFMHPITHFILENLILTTSIITSDLTFYSYFSSVFFFLCDIKHTISYLEVLAFSICSFSILVRLLVLTQEMGNSSSTDCTLIWTFTTLSGKKPSRRERLSAFFPSRKSQTCNPEQQYLAVLHFKATTSQLEEMSV